MTATKTKTKKPDTKRKPGRPSDPRDDKYQIRLTLEDRAKWDAEAERLSVDTSDVVRMAMAKFLGADVKIGLGGKVAIVYKEA